VDRLWHYALRETGIVEIESEWTARDREQETGAAPGEYFSAQVSAQNRGANLGHHARDSPRNPINYAKGSSHAGIRLRRGPGTINLRACSRRKGGRPKQPSTDSRQALPLLR